MRISDWSSDVCSSDLRTETLEDETKLQRNARDHRPAVRAVSGSHSAACFGQEARQEGISAKCLTERQVWSSASDLVEEWPTPDEAIFPCGPDHAVGAPPAPTAKPTPVWSNPALAHQIGRAHVRTPITNAYLACRLLLPQK